MGKSDEAVLLHGGYKSYKIRWFHLLLFILLTVANAITWITFSPISDKVQDFYDLDSNIYVNLLSISFMIVYIPLTFPASWAIDQIGLRFGLLTGAFFTFIGAWVRVCGEWSFYPIYVGQILAAIGQPFILNAPPSLALSWFPENQRTVATTIASVANPVGVGIGFLLPPAFVTWPNDIPFMLFIQACIVSALVVPFVLFFRSEPKTPPSAGASRDYNAETDAFWPSLKLIASNWNFYFLFLVTGFGLGSFNTLATVINELIEPYGYSNTESGVLGALVIVLGLVGSAILGVFVDFTHWYKWTIFASLVGATGSAVMMTLFLRKHFFYELCVAAACLGATATPVLPLSLELGVETTYPAGEASVTGLLVTSGQIVGIAESFLLGWLAENDNGFIAGWIVVGCMSVAAVCMFIFRGKLRRMEFEKKQEEEGKIQAEDTA
eukprot:CAMPEP_0174258512 /NCGR_PEP_ID=MMETSP0439-20130205/7488_1 /TAXON_ID=0 /ORGANISM="Stereomyxa ramosa, Strain Chinc5" /LENGTH=437 /DNA_ID=CAMNT_0015342045 /DNA_START=49 /DNA_END=1362 /DNA_ORIENTATION=-